MPASYGGTSEESPTSEEVPESPSTTTNEAEATDTDSLLPKAVEASPTEKGAVIPEELDPWSLTNVAIMSSYFCVGFGMSFIGTPLSYYMIDTLNATAEQV